MFSGPSTLLLTGATGLIGSRLLGRLLSSKPDRFVFALTRQRGKFVSPGLDSRLTVLEGDLSRPGLGLDKAVLSKLQSSLTEIVHCAAETRFGLPLEEARATNTYGTRQLLDLARCCKRLEKYVHLSTVYVTGRSTGVTPEAPLQHANGFCNSYQQSKYEAELLVVEAMGHIPAAIFRLSSILGDSQTGKVDQFNYVHQLLKLFSRNVLPVAPADPTAPVDLIPTGWAIAALAHLFDGAFVPGRVYNLCGGPEASLTVAELIDLTIAAFEKHPMGYRWLPIRIPELVSLPEYEAFVEASRSKGDRLLNELLRVLSYFLPHLGLFQAFENNNTRRGLVGSGLELRPAREYYPKVIDYCLETDWGKLELHT
jgi:nucleoside-diphosphate-sugar epimerase